MSDRKLVLASTSRYRAKLLARLQIPFEIVAPQVDESPLPAETPADTALRLAIAKAHAVRTLHPGALIIGSDQVADLDGVAIGKPGKRESAVSQLRLLRGKRVIFHTALCLLDSVSGRSQSRIVPTVVILRSYTDREIEVYLDKESALDCAGSAKSEGLGIALMASLEADDPTALVGLPLIALAQMLAADGVSVLSG